MKNNIARIREIFNISQEEMANIMGISRPKLSLAERGKAKLDIDECYKVIDFFKDLEVEIDIDTIFGKKNKIIIYLK